MRTETATPTLKTLMGADSDALCARVWRGYVAHALFFYRQNDISGFRELQSLGEAVPFGAGRTPFPADLGGGSASSPSWKKALRAMRRKEARPAERLLTDAIRREPENAALYLLRGLCRYEWYWGSLRFSPGSIADFERAASLAPDEAWALLLSGMGHEMHRRYARAVEYFDAAAALEPRWVWPRILRGICRWYQAEFRGCVEDFQRALDSDPDCVPALLFLSRTKSDLRDRSLVADLDRAARLQPRSGLVLSWRGRAKFIVRRTPESLADLRRSVRLLPDYDRGYSWLGISYLELGRTREAAQELARAARLNPFYPTTLYPWARCLMEGGDWEKAGGVLKNAAAVDRAGVWVEQRISMNHPNPACLRSLEDLDRYLKARPRSAWALAWRGQTRLLLREYRAALPDLDAAAALAPRDPWARLWRGEVHRRQGYNARALVEFAAALRLDPKLGWAWAGKGWSLLAGGDAAGALAALDRSLRLQPQNAAALAWRGEALLALGRFDAAAGDLEAALELRPQSRWVCGRLWRAHARRGDRPGAARALRLWGDGGASRADRALSLLDRSPIEDIERELDDEDPEASLAPGVLGAYCRERESKECLLAFEGGDYAAVLRALSFQGSAGELRGFLFRAWLKLRCGDAEGAVEEASRALDEGLDPFCAAALSLRAAAKNSLGRVEAAAEDARRLARLRAGGAPALAGTR